MNPVYIRLALYTLAGSMAALGVGNFDAASGTLTLDLNQMAIVLAGSSFVTGLVFAIWGKK